MSPAPIPVASMLVGESGRVPEREEEDVADGSELHEGCSLKVITGNWRVVDFTCEIQVSTVA